MTAAVSELCAPAEFEPNYNLSQLEVNDLATSLLAARPSGVDNRFVVYELQGDDPYANLGRTVEATVFNQSFANNTVKMQTEYGPYEAASSFFVVMDQKGRQPVGALRVIRNSAAGLKTLNDLAGDPLHVAVAEFQQVHNVPNLDKCWDVGTLAVLPEFRTSPLKSAVSKNPQPNIMLYRALYAKARYEGIDHFAAIIDDKALSGLRLLGVPFVPLAGREPFSYLGSSVSHALYGYVPEFYDKMDARYSRLKETHPKKSRFLARPLGQLMLGERTDHALLLNYE